MKISILEVNLSAIKNNLANVRKLLKHNQRLCIVAKANCYGLGAKEVCKKLNKFADYFAVSSAKEFYEIRKVVDRPIVILDPVYKGLKRLIKSGAEITISNFESLSVLLEEIEFLNEIVKVHIAINTGMNRFGFKTKTDIFDAITILKKSQKITIIGVFSHYYDVNNEKFANLQYGKFLKIKKFCEEKFGLNSIYHLANSDGITLKNGFDMVRAGMVLYTDKSYQTITLKSKILDIQNLSKNETAGYSAVFVAKEQKRLAIVGIGYGDGIMRNIVKNGYVLINGKYAKIVAICMDTMLVDITKIDAKICDDVVLIGRSKNKQIFICDMASWCDTIDYEIIVRLSNRIERNYVS
ncbi:MAG: alanine racemase [Clostridia bacterium]|nr:alanine racemase [Clostridia bacterium]